MRVIKVFQLIASGLSRLCHRTHTISWKTLKEEPKLPRRRGNSMCGQLQGLDFSCPSWHLPQGGHTCLASPQLCTPIPYNKSLYIVSQGSSSPVEPCLTHQYFLTSLLSPMYRSLYRMAGENLVVKEEMRIFMFT